MDLSAIAKRHRIPESDELLIIGDVVEQAVAEAIPGTLPREIAELRADLHAIRAEHVDRPRWRRRLVYGCAGALALTCSAVIFTAGWTAHAPLIAVTVLCGLCVFFLVVAVAGGNL